MKLKLLGIALVGLAFSASAKTIYVAEDGNDTTGDGSFENPYLTPSNGIAQAYADETVDTVFLKEGTYKIDKVLTLDRPLTLKGENRDATTVRQNKTGTARVIEISDAGVRVESLSISHGYNGDAGGGNLFMSAGIVSNCVIHPKIVS